MHPKADFLTSVLLSSVPPVARTSRRSTAYGFRRLLFRKQYKPCVVIHIEVLLRRRLNLRRCQLLDHLVIGSAEAGDVFAGLDRARRCCLPSRSSV
jgi:hypothetical protein